MKESGGDRIEDILAQVRETTPRKFRVTLRILSLAVVVSSLIIIAILTYFSLLQTTISITERHGVRDEYEFIIELSHLSIFSREANYSLNDFVDPDKTAYSQQWKLYDHVRYQDYGIVSADQKVLLASGYHWHLNLYYTPHEPNRRYLPPVTNRPVI